MNNENTPGFGDVLEKNNLSDIPEAHCYLKVNEIVEYNFLNIKDINDIVIVIILPNQLGNICIKILLKKNIVP